MENNQNLAESLKISSPTFYSLSDSVMNISRFNKVEINWGDIIDELNTQEYLRDYFLEHCFIEVSKETKLSECQGRNKFWEYFSGNVETIEEVITGQLDAAGEPITVLKPVVAPRELFCITLKQPRRKYVVGKAGKYLEKADIDPFLDKTIEELWKEFDKQDYDYFVTYFDSKSDLLAFDKGPSNEAVSRELLFYKEKFGHFSAKLAFIQQVNKKISSDFTASILSDQENLKKLFGDSDLLSFYLTNYSRINLVEIDLEKEIDFIQNKLFEKGYYLETEKSDGGKNRTVWGKSFVAQYGEIYSLVDVEVVKKVEEVVEKTVQEEFHGRPSPRDAHGKPIRIANGEAAWEATGTRTRVVKETIVKLIPTTETQILPVQIKDDPIYEKILKLKGNGYWVHVFENINGSFLSSNGDNLSEVINECEDSEETRIHTVVVIKDYESVDLTNKAVIRATFYYRPIRAIIPTKLPAIGIRESLDYRMSWSGLEVGKLIDSICLAPGETKTVAISNKFSTVSSSTTSSKTFNEINSVQSNEYSTELEKLVTNELEKTSESSSSVSAGASYGGLVRASGDMKQSNKETIKDFTKNLNRSTSKATSTLSKRASLEVSFSTSTSTETTSTSTRTSTVSNINQGRTLNLFYYQVNNKFKSRVYLENLKLEIGSSFELIENSGIYDSFSAKFSDIKKIIFHIQIFVPNLKVDEENTDLRKVIKAVIHTLNEYTNKPLLVDDADEVLLTKLNSLDIIKIEDTFAEKINDSPNFSEMISAYKMLVSSIQFDNLYFNEETFIIDSGTYYLDSQVGINPATEEYSETMRKLESYKIETEIEKQKSLNEELKAKTKLLNSGDAFITNIESFSQNIVPDGGGLSERVDFSLLTLSSEIPDEAWEVYVKNRLVTDCTLKRYENGLSMTITWKTLAPSQNELEDSLILVSNGKVLKYI